MSKMVHYAYNEKTKQYDIPWYEDEEYVSDDNALKHDSINHPSHYNSGKIEVIDFIEDQDLNFHLANALKYICRAGKKDASKTKEDLEKAVWYLNRYITYVLEPGHDQQ